MKKITSYISLLFIATALFLSSCSPDDFKLGAIDVTPGELVEGIAFTITHDAENPNIVYLENKMDKRYTPVWDHPQGRSQENKVTLRMPFPGTYTVKFGVETRGGIVYGEPEKFEVESMYSDFISDPMWTMVAGGAGESKTWYLDLDADAVSRNFTGPIYFFTNTYSWDNLHTPDGQNYLDSDSWNWEEAITPLAGADGAEWYWLADYPGNTWITDAADFGTMTFDLIGGANLVTDQEAYGLGKTKGTFMLDTDNHTIKFTDVYPVHDSGRHGEMEAATEFRILYLTEDAMQIMVVPSGVSYNYISKDYKDNWTPGDVVLPDGWKDDVSQIVTTEIKWVLSDKTPFNWARMDGARLNDWKNPGDYPSWTGFNPNIPQTYRNFSLVMDSKTNSVVYTAPDGTETTGTYKLDNKGIYTFDEVTPNFKITESVSLTTTAGNEWKITAIEKEGGMISGMWVGVIDPVKAEYIVFHLVPSFEDEPSGPVIEGTDIAFDNSKLLYGDLENKGNIRLEIYNAYGGTAADPGINPDDVVIANRLFVVFTLKGINLKASATGQYSGAVSFANGDWSAQYWGGGGGDVTINGDGTYTAWCDVASAGGLAVFTIDISNIMGDIEDPSAIEATIDRIVVN